MAFIWGYYINKMAKSQGNKTHILALNQGYGSRC